MTVEELFFIVTPRLAGTKPACNIFEALRGVQQIIVNRLLLRRSDLVQESIMFEISAGDAAVSLPDGFSSVESLPVLTGKGNLFPLPKNADKSLSSLTTAGEPKYYEVKNRTMTFFPPPDASSTLIVPAFVRPEVPGEMDDELPFYGAFDDVYVEGAVKVLAAGLSAVSDRAFSDVINSQVDQVLAAKDLADEQTEAEAINRGA